MAFGAIGAVGHFFVAPFGILGHLGHSFVAFKAPEYTIRGTVNDIRKNYCNCKTQFEITASTYKND